MTREADDLAPTERFSSRVEHYAKWRPHYPRTLLNLLEREAGFSASTIVADVGSGTGILTALLLSNGNQVFAVEPNADMRRAAEKWLAGSSKFHSRDGMGEATGLPDASVDAIVVAQAFHWFDPVKAAHEFRRITRAGGFIALIWNVRAIQATPFMAEYERIVTTHGSDFARSGKELVPFQTLRKLFPGLTEHGLPNHQDLDWEGLRGRLLSASYMPLAGQPGHEPMLADLHAAFGRYNTAGQVRMDYDTRIYLCSQSGSGG